MIGLVAIPLLITAAIIIIFLSRAYSEVNDDFLREWSQAHGLTLTPTNVLMVRWYLHHARVLRTWGALGGFLLPSLIGAAVGWDGDGGLPFVWIFVGYLVGALYAELSLVRPVGSGRRTASLVPRELDDYLPRRLLWAQRGLGAAVVVGGVAALLVPSGERSPGTDLDTGIAIAAVCGAILAVALERLQRWLVRRPQPFTDPSLVAADDAIRSQSVHSLSGSGLAILLLVFTFVDAALAMSDLQILRWTMWVPTVFGGLASIYVCLYYGHRAWRVRRPVALGPTTAAP